MTDCSFDPHGNYSVALAIIGVAFAIAWVRVEYWRCKRPMRAQREVKDKADV